MHIITWNCQGAFRKKANEILKFSPDILVIQECECLDQLNFDPVFQTPTDKLWLGENKNKGLAVFSFGRIKLKLLEIHNSNIKYAAPILVNDGNSEFILLAIWANNKDDEDGQYIEQVYKAITYYEDLLLKNNSIIIGDFNSNKIWDKPRRTMNHTALVENLIGKNIHSAYHYHLNQEQGKEQHPTFYLQRNQSKPYHIDYCFATDVFIEKIKYLNVGEFSEWITLSDHMPVFVEFLENS